MKSWFEIKFFNCDFDFKSFSNKWFLILISNQFCMILISKENQNDLHFVKYNTSLTLFAAVERLFNCAGLVATSRRNRLSDSTFDKLLMLKANYYEPQWLLTMTLFLNIAEMLANWFEWQMILIWNCLENSGFDFTSFYVLQLVSLYKYCNYSLLHLSAFFWISA